MLAGGPSLSAMRARLISCAPPVSMSVARVQPTAAANGAKGLPGRTSPTIANATHATMPTSHPTPGKWAALARVLTGLEPSHCASVPVTGTRVKDWTALRYWRRKLT